MDEFEGVCYKNNYLQPVICRVDFEDLLKDDLFDSKELEKTITNYFNKQKPNQIVNINSMEVTKKHDTPVEFSENIESFLQKTYSDNSGLNNIVITKSYMFFEFKNYEKFETLYESFNAIMNVIIKKQTNIQIKRFGLRYINIFEKEQIKILKKYFKGAVSELVSVKTNQDLPLSRAMIEYEYIFDNIRIKARCGKFNRHYPGELKIDDFVLDFDAYLEGINYCREIFPETIEKAHSKIQLIFESVITDDLRKILSNGK